MPFFIIIPLALVAVGLAVGYLVSDAPPLSRRWLVRITANVVTHEGPILTAKVKDIEHILSRFVVESGFVACDSDGNVVFSATIPEETHQQIRNVVFS